MTLYSICHAEMENRNLLTYKSLDAKSLDASGGSVFRIMTGPAMLE
jgi:hypothetical protein